MKGNLEGCCLKDGSFLSLCILHWHCIRWFSSCPAWTTNKRKGYLRAQACLQVLESYRCSGSRSEVNRMWSLLSHADATGCTTAVTCLVLAARSTCFLLALQFSDLLLKTFEMVMMDRIRATVSLALKPASVPRAKMQRELWMWKLKTADVATLISPNSQTGLCTAPVYAPSPLNKPQAHQRCVNVAPTRSSSETFGKMSHTREGGSWKQRNLPGMRQWWKHTQTAAQRQKIPVPLAESNNTLLSIVT